MIFPALELVHPIIDGRESGDREFTTNVGRLLHARSKGSSLKGCSSFLGTLILVMPISVDQLKDEATPEFTSVATLESSLLV